MRVLGRSAADARTLSGSAAMETSMSSRLCQSLMKWAGLSHPLLKSDQRTRSCQRLLIPWRRLRESIRQNVSRIRNPIHSRNRHL